MQLYKTRLGVLLLYKQKAFIINEAWDELINRHNLEGYLRKKADTSNELSEFEKDRWLSDDMILAPIGSQEVWAAGVTYLKSRDARMEESEKSGAANLYDKVYDAERPELFFKANALRVAGPCQQVYIRKDSVWNVPEPELTLFINSEGKIEAYTVGNDMSSRSIEGENALYLPQAKIYDRSAALGPCLYVASVPIATQTEIKMQIERNGKIIFDDSTSVSRIKRSFTELTEHLFRECDFPQGCFLMTGTCLVPGGDFTLQVGDVVMITINGIGTLINTVNVNPKNRYT